MKKTILPLLFLLAFNEAGSQTPYMVKDVNTGTASINGGGLYPVSNGILTVVSDAVNGTELWFSDGTSGNTKMLIDINPGPASSYPSFFFNLNNKLFFWANNGTNGNELWQSDGTVSGTFLVKDVVSGSAGSTPNIIFNAGTKVYFCTGQIGTGNELYVTDGTPSGTNFVKDIYPGSGSSGAADFISEGNGKVFFTANDGVSGKEVWYSDGTPAGTNLTKDIFNGSWTHYPTMMMVINDVLFFAPVDTINGRELWRSDGTASGTFLLKNISTGFTWTEFSGWAKHNNKFFFITGTTVSGSGKAGESDGTVAGTKTGNPGSLYGSFYSNFYEFNNRLYFFKRLTYPGKDTLALCYLTDSLTNVTFVKSIGYQHVNYSPTPVEIQIKQTNNGKFLFHEVVINSTTIQNTNIGVSDGTANGTILSNKKSAFSYSEYTKPLPFLNNQWVDLMELGSKFNMEFHTIDNATGTAALLKNINPGGSCFKPFDNCYNTGWCFSNLIVGNKIYFVANDSLTGNELYQSDCTGAGTFLLKDIFPGMKSGLNADYNDCGFDIQLGGDKIFFFANDSLYGTELWSMQVDVGIKENTETNNLFEVYPNPAQSVLFINSTTFSISKAYIEITDMLGKTVQKQQSSDLNNLAINIGELPGGIYFVTLISDNKKAVKKFIKQ